MRKLRSDATWNELAPDQIGRLDDWLFEENLSYAEILRRLAADFGLKVSRTSLGRYFRRQSMERQAVEWARAQIDASATVPSPAATNALSVAALKRVEVAISSLTVDKPKDLAALVAVTKLLLASERKVLLRSRVSQANLEFKYQATTQSNVDLQHFLARTEAIQNDSQLSESSRVERFDAISRIMGWEKAAWRRKQNHPEVLNNTKCD